MVLLPFLLARIICIQLAWVGASYPTKASEMTLNATEQVRGRAVFIYQRAAKTSSSYAGFTVPWSKSTPRTPWRTVALTNFPARWVIALDSLLEEYHD